MQDSTLLNKNSVDLYDQYYNKPISEFKECVKAKVETDIGIYKTTFENTGLDCVKTTYVIPHCSVKAVKNHVLNSNWEELLAREKELKEGRTIKTENGVEYQYMLYDIPMLSIREYVLAVSCMERGKQTIIQTHSVDLPEVPENQKYIRSEIHSVMYVEAIPGTLNVRVTSIDYFDMKGSVPKMVMNMLIDEQGKVEAKKIIEGSLKEQQKL